MNDDERETLIPHSSTNVVKFEWWPSKSVLQVEFKNGGVYEYTGVPQSVFDELRNGHMRGESAGKFIAQRIKGYYDGKKVS